MQTICGLDEAGRGALAGPLVLAAVILPTNFLFEELNSKIKIRDSKTLSRLQREKAYELIQKTSLKIDVEIIDTDAINGNGIGWANEEGFRRLIQRNEALSFVIDGRWKIKGLNGKEKITTSVIDADSTIASVVASGIVAKVTRDEIMNRLHGEFGNYGWNKNCGYGTLKHIQAINEFGVCCYHRNMFVETALRNFKNHGR